ncbi:MAG: hypothetical protein FWF11_05050, partial [Coriobacteriia bacterium]|nr:hypothetical protein [Coriobacteriia bacterium]
FEVELSDGLPAAISLFSESQSRVVVTCSTGDTAAVLQQLEDAAVPAAVIGTVGGTQLKIADKIDLPLQQLREVWTDSLTNALAAGSTEKTAA